MSEATRPGSGVGVAPATPYLFLLPLLVFALVFLALPLVASIGLTFTRWNPLGLPRFTGLAEYEALLFRDSAFWRTLLNTFVVAGGLVAIGVPLALVLAAAFTRARGRAAWRAIFYLPQLTNVVAIGYIWQFILDDRYGLVNRLFALVGLPGANWLTDPATALLCVVGVMVWYEVGRNMLIFAAAIEAVDPLIYDAARLDGAGPVRTFALITVPLVRPAVLFVTITSFITGMGWFALIFAMTGGGPDGATRVTALYMYQMAFEDLRMGRASAAAMILFAIIALLSLLQVRLLRGRP